MALDAVCINALAAEFNSSLLGLRIDKIYQPENDELIITLHAAGVQKKLLLSANANIPRACFTSLSKENPASPPMFCMLLRKHLANGKIAEVFQPNFERIIEFKIEAKNDFGDIVVKTLIIEIMGRHSNIILVDENGKISGSIKHVDFSVSSVRQILPGLMYEYPPAQDKENPLKLTLEDFTDLFKNIPLGVSCEKYISLHLLGVSALTAREIASLAGLSGKCGGELNFNAVLDLASCASSFFSSVKNKCFSPCIIENAQNGKLMDYSPVLITQYGTLAKITEFESISDVIDSFYRARAQHERMAQRSASLLKTVSNNISRCAKKYEIQSRELAASQKKEKYRMYGELITANMYKIKKGDNELIALNYLTEPFEEVAVPLDNTLSPSLNAQRYFKKYNKLKNAEIHLTQELENTKAELNYLETVEEALLSAKSLRELSEIREELSLGAYVKSSEKGQKKKNSPSSPELTSFTTSDGFTVFIGKNNKQNDYLTTKTARGSDLWFHTKNIPGSHVVLRHEHNRPFTENAIFEAAQAAAYNSKAKNSDNVLVDYTLIKNVKKPNGARPGFVIFTENKTLCVTPKNYE